MPLSLSSSLTNEELNELKAYPNAWNQFLLKRQKVHCSWEKMQVCMTQQYAGMFKQCEDEEDRTFLQNKLNDLSNSLESPFVELERAEFVEIFKNIKETDNTRITIDCVLQQFIGHCQQQIKCSVNQFMTDCN